MKSFFSIALGIFFLTNGFLVTQTFAEQPIDYSCTCNNGSDKICLDPSEEANSGLEFVNVPDSCPQGFSEVVFSPWVDLSTKPCVGINASTGADENGVFVCRSPWKPIMSDSRIPKTGVKINIPPPTPAPTPAPLAPIPTPSGPMAPGGPTPQR